MAGDGKEWISLSKLKAMIREFRPDVAHLHNIHHQLSPSIVDALREYEVINASIDGENIVYHGSVNLGMAVALDWGLIVPVIRNADEKGLRSLGTEFRSLVERARIGRSLPDDLSGGTFTITNLGMYSVSRFLAAPAEVRRPDEGSVGGELGDERIQVARRAAVGFVLALLALHLAPPARADRLTLHVARDPWVTLAGATDRAWRAQPSSSSKSGLDCEI